MTSGAPIYDTNEDLRDAIERYFEIHVKKGDNVPSIEGISYFLGYAGRDEFGRQKKRGLDFARTIKLTRARIADHKLSEAAKGKLNATIVIFDLVNNHNYINTRSDNKNTDTVTVTEKLTDSQLDDRIKALENRLNAETD